MILLVSQIKINISQNIFWCLILISKLAILTPFPFLGDIQVSIGHINNGDYVWGITILLMNFLPNLVFMLWFIQGLKGQLLKPRSWAMIFLAGSVQLITLMRYVLFQYCEKKMLLKNIMKDKCYII